MDKNKLTSLMKRAAPFITGLAGDVNEETVDKDIEAVLMALETHKDSADHDDDAHVWTALNKFMQVMEVSGIMPIVGDSADIGSPTHLFRKGFFSELSTLIFKKENVLVMDGTFVLCKQSGKFVADVAASDTQIDFGQALTVGDILILRAENKMEYMKVGTKVSGTESTYNVTRNLDGSGADAWPAESVYFVRGKAGDGWLELTASGEQRMSVFTQGAAWNQNTEVVRIGTLDGWQKAGFSGMGMAYGNFAAGKYLVYSALTGDWTQAGGKMIAGNGNVVIDELGIKIKALGGTGQQAFKMLHQTSNKDMLTFNGAHSVGNTEGAMIFMNPEGEHASYVMFSIGARNLIPGSTTINSMLTFRARYDGVASANFNGYLNAKDITVAPSANNIPRAGANGKLDAGWLPDIPAPYTPPVWQSWTPTLTGWSLINLTRACRFRRDGNTVYFNVYVYGISKSTDARISLPPGLPAVNITDLYWRGISGGMDNGAALTAPIMWQISPGGTEIFCYSNLTAGGWTASGNKLVAFQGFYETSAT